MTKCFFCVILINNVVKYSLALFFSGFVFISAGTSSNTDLIGESDLSPLEKVEQRYANGYYTEKRLDFLFSIVDTDREQRINDLLHFRRTLINTHSQDEYQNKVLEHVNKELKTMGVSLDKDFDDSARKNQ